MALLLSAVGVALGAFVAVEPARAAQIWGSERLKKLAPRHRAVFLLGFRAFGIFLCLGAALVAVESIVFPDYQR
jgi:hypothetical protein